MRTFLASSLMALSVTLTASDAPPDYRFKVETLFENIPQPMEIEIAPDGRIFLMNMVVS